MTQMEKDMANWARLRSEIVSTIIRSHKYTLISGSYVVVKTGNNKAMLIQQARQAKVSRMTVVANNGDIVFENKQQKAYNNQ